MTDNVAILDGYTEEVYMEGGGFELYLLVKPDTDLEGSFRAWDTDEQAYIKVNGWNFTQDGWMFSIED